jgi:hypothetical protein
MASAPRSGSNTSTTTVTLKTGHGPLRAPLSDFNVRLFGWRSICLGWRVTAVVAILDQFLTLTFCTTITSSFFTTSSFKLTTRYGFYALSTLHDIFFEWSSWIVRSIPTLSSSPPTAFRNYHHYRHIFMLPSFPTSTTSVTTSSFSFGFFYLEHEHDRYWFSCCWR